MSCVLVFFFQAEDGIRDGHVTGVQTCALPISWTRTALKTIPIWIRSERLPRKKAQSWSPSATNWKRSEERRVGKECRWWRKRGDEKERRSEEGRHGKKRRAYRNEEHRKDVRER